MSAAGERWIQLKKEGKEEYGPGAGRASLCVKYVACLKCGARVGELCKGTNGPQLTRHYIRAYAHQEKLGKATPMMLSALRGYR
jgi:hypothetical protein